MGLSRTVGVKVGRFVTDEDAAPFRFVSNSGVDRVVSVTFDTACGAHEGLSFLGNKLESMFLTESRKGRGRATIYTAWSSFPLEEETRSLWAGWATRTRLAIVGAGVLAVLSRKVNLDHFL